MGVKYGCGTSYSRNFFDSVVFAVLIIVIINDSTLQ